MAEQKEKEPFVKGGDRPDIELDKPLSELRVRDLAAILGIELNTELKRVYKDVTNKVFRDKDIRDAKHDIDTQVYKYAGEYDIRIPIDFQPNPLEVLIKEVAALKTQVEAMEKLMKK